MPPKYSIRKTESWNTIAAVVRNVQILMLAPVFDKSMLGNARMETWIYKALSGDIRQCIMTEHNVDYNVGRRLKKVHA